ncbi:MAG: phospho-N-acetylmuramoyl-pentapeptide-transferase [Planctomycetota bacterium]|nr:MAG: phospho-N-acetylmuramoyl-pentapeptide-transferase [Planctomycetota bacterium]
MLAGTSAGGLAFADLTQPAPWILLVSLWALGALGFADDWTKTFGARRTAGLTPRQKLVGQVALGFLVGLCLLFVSAQRGELDARTTLTLPFLGLGLGIGSAGFVLLSAFLVTGSSNAVNLTDGLDGLAGGCGLVALGVYLLLALASGDPAAAARLGLAVVPGAGEVAVVLAALFGGLVGFLVFNRHPARCFLGDAGSLPLGGALAVSALLVRQELLLALVGAVFVVEALSVMAQVGSFKLTGKRVLRCAPLHHHFEFQGYRETQIVSGFHAAALLCGLVGLVGLGLCA